MPLSIKDLMKVMSKVDKKKKKKKAKKANKKRKMTQELLQNNKPNFGHQSQLGGGGGGGGTSSNPLYQRSAPAVTTVVNTPSDGKSNIAPNPLSTEGLAKESKLLELTKDMNRKIRDKDQQLAEYKNQIDDNIDYIDKYNEHMESELKEKFSKYDQSHSLIARDFNTVLNYVDNGFNQLRGLEKKIKYLTENPLSNVQSGSFREPMQGADRMDGNGIFPGSLTQHLNTQQMIEQPVDESLQIEYPMSYDEIIDTLVDEPPEENQAEKQVDIQEDQPEENQAEQQVDIQEDQPEENEAEQQVDLQEEQPSETEPFPKLEDLEKINEAFNKLSGKAHILDSNVKEIAAHPLSQESLSQLNEPTNLNSPLTTNEEQSYDRSILVKMEKANKKQKKPKEEVQEEEEEEEEVQEEEEPVVAPKKMTPAESLAKAREASVKKRKEEAARKEAGRLKRIEELAKEQAAAKEQKEKEAQEKPKTKGKK